MPSYPPHPQTPPPPPPQKKKDKKKEKYLSGLFLSSQALFTLELLSEEGAVRVKSLFHKRALIQLSL